MAFAPIVSRSALTMGFNILRSFGAQQYQTQLRRAHSKAEALRRRLLWGIHGQSNGIIFYDASYTASFSDEFYPA